jgi:RNA polymerase sigma-70 factor, ECF subfamily
MTCPNPPELPENSASSDAYMTRASLFERMNDSSAEGRNIAWAEFRKRYAPVISGFALRCGAKGADVDDIVQDVLTSFLSSSNTFSYDSMRGRFRSYLKTCSVRATLKRVGANLRYRGRPLETISEPEAAVEPLWDDAWEEQLVARALQTLRSRLRNSAEFQAFEEYVLKNRAAAEVAEELQVTVNYVHQSKSRMTKQLRDIVQGLRSLEE